MKQTLQWRGDNARDFAKALRLFEATVIHEGDQLFIVSLGKSIDPLELGDEVTVRQNGIEITRPRRPDRSKRDRWMIWTGDNMQEVVDFLELGEWEMGIKSVGLDLYIKAHRGQQTPTLLHPGDSIIENKSGLWFRRKDTRQ